MCSFAQYFFFLSMLFSDDLVINAQTIVNVTTSLGVIQGQIVQTTGGNSIQAFRGVPYAISPPLRFVRTVPLTALPSNPYNAFTQQPACARWDIDGKTYDRTSSEDCLYLKILTPANVAAGATLPVMFWIQGGGFNDGTFISYDINALGDNFVSKGIVVVQVQHRQGPLGFFTSGTSDATGNWGVWDALEALRFVNTYINNFGGDRNRVTIMGQESGGVMAELLSLTPLANGLYSSMLLIDSSAFDPAVIKNDNVNILRSAQLAVAVNCDNLTSNLWGTNQRLQVVNCLKNTVGTPALVSAIGRSDIAPIDPGSSFANYFWRPRVDGLLYNESFENLALRRPVVPTMIGIMKDGWTVELYKFVSTSQSATLPADFNTVYNTADFVNRTCTNLMTAEIYGSTLVNSLSNLCRQKYASNTVADASDTYFWAHRGARVSTGFHSMAPLVKTVGFMRNQGNAQVYIYSFDYDRGANGGAFYQALGAYRGLDIQLVENFFPPFTADARDIVVRDLFADLMTNFVRFLNPTPANYTKARWNINGLGNCYMSVNSTPVMLPAFYNDDAQFWITNGGLS